MICLIRAFFLSWLLVELGLVTFGHMQMLAFLRELAMPML